MLVVAIKVKLIYIGSIIEKFIYQSKFKLTTNEANEALAHPL